MKMLKIICCGVLLCTVLSGCESRIESTETHVKDGPVEKVVNAINEKSTENLSLENDIEKATGESGTDLVDAESSIEETAQNSVEEVTTENSTEEDKNEIIKNAIRNRTFYSVSPQSGMVEEYVFLDNHKLQHRRFFDLQGEINEIENTSYDFIAYRINDDNTLSLIRDIRCGSPREEKFYYIEDYDFFRTEVIPEYGENSMPPQYWAYGIYPYDYTVGKSGDMTRYWCEVLAPTFCSEYLSDYCYSETSEESTEVIEADILSDEQAIIAVRNYCYAVNPDLENVVNSGEYPVYWDINESNDHTKIVVFRSYTGALRYFYIDLYSGNTYITEFVPGISVEEEQTGESFLIWDYMY